MKIDEFAQRFANELKSLIQHNPDFSDYFVDGLVYRRRDWIKNRVCELVSGNAKKWESGVLESQYLAVPWRGRKGGESGQD